MSGSGSFSAAYLLGSSLTIGGTRTGKTLTMMGSWTPSIFPSLNPQGFPYPEWFHEISYMETVGPKIPYHAFDWRKRTVTIGRLRYNEYEPENPRLNDARDLVEAVLKSKTDTVHGLLDLGVKPNQRVEGGMTAAFALTFTEEKDQIVPMARLLRLYGADFNVEMERGQTPLLFACDRGNDEAVKIILAMGGKVNHRCAGGETPLGFAIRNCSMQTVVALISHGADVNAVSDQGVSCLQQAVHSHDAKVVELLINCGAKADVFNGMGLTPFHVAALSLSTHLDVLTVLAPHYDVNAQVQVSHPDQPMAGTVLHLCSKASIPLTVVKHLVSLGCDPFAKDPQGKTALEVCPEETRASGVYEYLFSLKTERELNSVIDKSSYPAKRSRL